MAGQLLTFQVQVTYGQGHVKVTFELEIQVGTLQMILEFNCAV